MTKKETSPDPEGNSELEPEDELVSSTSLFAKCDIDVIPIALRIAKNLRKDLRLRCHALKIIFKNRSICSDILRNESVVSDFTDIALESFNNEYKSLRHFNLKRYAFQCLKSVSNDLSDDFYQAYKLHLKKQIIPQSNSCINTPLKKFDDYIAACEKNAKFRILEALSVALSESNSGLDISIFDELPPSTWAKEALVYALLSNNFSWDVRQAPCFIEKINDLDNFIKEFDTRHRIEDVLMILIDTQSECRLDIGFINDILTSVGCCIECLDVITRDFCFLPTTFDELATVRLRSVCDRFKIVHTDRKDIAKLHRLLLYSDKATASIFNNIKPNTRLTDLISFLQLLKNTDRTLDWKEFFLLNLDRNDKSINDWKTKLYNEFVENAIRDQFPYYKCYSLHASPDEERNLDQRYFLPIACTNDKKHTKYWECRRSSKANLQKSMKSPESKRSIGKLLKDLQKTLSKVILNCGWSNKCKIMLETLIKSLDSEDKIMQLINSLEILVEYEIDVTGKKICDIFSQSSALDVQKNVNKFAVERTFPGTYKKSFDELIEELVDLNKNEEIGSTNIKESLMSKYADVMEAYCDKSKLLPDRGSINVWQKNDVADWVEKLAGHPQRSRVHKDQSLLSVINSFFVGDLNETLIKTAHCETQCSSIDKEGPMSSMINGLIFDDSKQTMDETPNKKARRQSKKNEPGFDVSQSERIAVIKRTAELISGFPLRDIQLLSVILFLSAEDAKGRLAQINTGEGKTIIIAMIAAYHATKGSKVDVITSSPLLAKPQSKQQLPFYSALGLTVSHNINNHSEGYEADVVYGTSQAFQGDILRDEFRKRKNRGERTCDIAIVDEVDNMLVDGNNYIVMLSSDMPAMNHLEAILATIFIQVNNVAKSIEQDEDGQHYIVDHENIYDEEGQVKHDVVENRYALGCSVKDFITDCTEKHIRNLIRDTPVEDESFPELKIPKHLRDLVCKAQLKKWIGRAIAAKFHYVKNEDYILRDGDIQIVDAANTGVVRMNSQWSNGLHQFLQIKHGGKISPESLTTNFISNVNFFQRYPPKIYGLTGTLGTNGTKELLSKTYGVDTVVVPPFKLKQHKELVPIIVNNRSDWYVEVAKSCLRKLNNGRAALIIMEYIRETEELEKKFKDYFRYDKSKIKLYKTDEDAAVVDKELKPGDVIITTNIAGRGTDIKLSKDIDINGGLHVCITFLPKNSRVELQNMGRTSRTGNRGTSQFVLCEPDESDIENLKANRAEKEIEAMEKADKEIVRVTTKDMIFKKFCALLHLIKGRSKSTRDIEKKAVEERFAIWLEINEEKIDDEPREKVIEDFETFESVIRQDEKDGKLIKNPYMHVTIGNEYLYRTGGRNYTKAIEEYTLAIDLDPHFAEHARYNRGYAYIAKYGGNLSNNLSEIDEAVADFEEARKLIQARQNELNLIQTASDGEVLSEQVRNKLNLYNVQKNAIDIAIGPDVKAINLHIKHLRKEKKSDNLTTEDKGKIIEAIDNLKKQKELVGVIQKARSSKNNIEIELRELKESLPEDDYITHETEIEEFERNGFIGEFKISEVLPIDWWAVFGLLVLGFAQLIGGAALCIFTLGGGSSLGMGLITEGLSDIITAVRDGIINRDFNWATWAIEKAISITVAVVCAGLSAIKKTAKAAWAGTKAAGKAAGTILSKGVSVPLRVGWKIVARRVGFELAKGIGKQIATDLINYGIDKTLIPYIERAIVDRIRGPIENALIENPMVKKMLELDEKVNKDRYYENRILSMGYEILNPKTNRGLREIALEVASRVANNKVKYLAVARQVAGAIEGLWKLQHFVENFIKDLNKAISDEAKKQKIDEKFDEMINKEEELSETINEDASRKEDDENIDVSRAHVQEEQVKLEERPPRSSKAISKEFVKAATGSMLNIIKGKFIAPVVDAGVNYAAEKLTASIKQSIDHDTKTYKAYKRVIDHNNRGLSDPENPQNPQNPSVTPEELAKADELTESARAGGPVGLWILGAASDSIDCPIDVYNENGQFMYTIGDKKKGRPVEIEYSKPKDGDDIGHYSLRGGKEPRNNSGGRNMCLYNVLAELSGQDPNALKQSMLLIMTNNRETFAKQASDIVHLEMYSKMNLALGGLIFDAKNPDETESYITESNDTFGFRNDKAHRPNPAHPGHHIPYRRTTEDHLEYSSAETKRNIEVYDSNGTLMKTYGKHTDGEPIKVEYRKPEGDTSGEYFTSIGGPEKSRLNDPRPENMDFWKVIAEQSEQDPGKLKTAVTKRMDERTIPSGTMCVEEASKPSRKPTKKSKPNKGKSGYISKGEAAYVIWHAMQLDSVKARRAKLNEYEKGTKDSAEYVSAEMEIDVAELNMPRTTYGVQCIDERITEVFPITGSIFIKMQHFEGKESDREARVQFQTSFPRRARPPDPCPPKE